MLEWTLAWGPHVDKLQGRAVEGKAALALESRPELYDDLADIWQAFMELHQSRSYGFGPNPIAIRDIETWLAMHDVTNADDRMEYYDLIRAMDAAWFAWFNKSQERKRKK